MFVLGLKMHLLGHRLHYFLVFITSFLFPKFQLNSIVLILMKGLFLGLFCAFSTLLTGVKITKKSWTLHNSCYLLKRYTMAGFKLTKNKWIVKKQRLHLLCDSGCNSQAFLGFCWIARMENMDCILQLQYA